MNTTTSQGPAAETAFGMSPEERLADMRLRLHDFMLGFADANADRMLTLAGVSWAGAAQIEQLRRQPLVGVLDDELLAAIATRAIDPNEDARYLAARLREVDEEAAAELVGDARLADTVADRIPELPPALARRAHASVEVIAQQRLGIDVLTLQTIGTLAAGEFPLVCIRAALIDAFMEGRRFKA